MPRIDNDKLPLCESDLDYLRARGLSDQTIIANKLRTEYDSGVLAKILNCGPGANACMGGLVFPFRDLSGTVNCYAIVKPHHPCEKNGKKIKYQAPKDSTARACFPAESITGLNNKDEPVHIAESPIKALALAQVGLTAIGLNGFFGGMKDGELIETLAEVPWEGRLAYVHFDHDTKVDTRLNNDIAKRNLAKALLSRGAGRVLDVRLPPGPDGGKMGVDDYLMQYGQVKLGQLIGSAPDVLDDDDDAGLKIVKIVSIVEEPELRPAALHGLAGDFIRAVEPLTEATAPCLLAHLLGAVASMLSGPRVGSTEQPARIFALVVGETTEGRKGTGWRLVDRLMRKAVPPFWGAQVSSGMSSGEGLIERVEDKFEKDEDGNITVVPVEKRLFVIEEEFASVLARMRGETNTVSHVIRCAFDSGDLETLTVKRRRAPGTHICIAAHCTPEELRQRLGYIESINGFANRFLIFASYSPKIQSKQTPIPDSVFDSLAKRVAAIHDRFNPKTLGESISGAVSGAVKPAPRLFIQLDRDAQTLWDEVYPGLRGSRPGLVGAMTARRATYALRLALLYWAMDDKRVKQVAKEHLEAGLAVVDYCQQSAELIFGDRVGINVLDRIIQLLKQTPMSKTELNKHFSNNQKADLNGWLAQLEAQGRIERKTERTGGAPKTVYAVK